MKLNLFALLAAVCVASLSLGCYSTVEGKKKAGVKFGTDQIESRYERKPAELFAAAKQVLGFMGTLTSENTIASTLEAKVDDNTVWVKVTEVEPGIAQVLVQSRASSVKGNVALASEVDKRIALELQAR
jgi:hypothetical protein